MKIIFFYLSCLFVLSIACQSTGFEMKRKDFAKKTYYNSRIQVDADNNPLDTLQVYFPEMQNDDSTAYDIVNGKTYPIVYTRQTTNIDSFRNAWYSRNLRALKEPLLFNKSFDKEIIRFTWLRTFHNPIAIRVVKSEQSIDLYWKLCDGAGGYEPGNLIINRSKKLKIGEWNKILKYLDNASFWTPKFVREALGYDGAQWIIEATGPDYYQVMDVWCGGDLISVGLYLLSLTDIVVEKDKIY